MIGWGQCIVAKNKVVVLCSCETAIIWNESKSLGGFHLIAHALFQFKRDRETMKNMHNYEVMENTTHEYRSFLSSGQIKVVKI